MTWLERLERAAAASEVRAARARHRADVARRTRQEDRANVRAAEAAGKRPRPRMKGRTFSDTTPRRLEPADVTDFERASGEARDRGRRELDKAYPSTMTDLDRDQFIAWIKARHPFRMTRLGKEIDWLRAEARKYGINPEEIRWLL